MTGSRSWRCTTPAHGTITGFGTGHFNYTPDAGFSGTDTITYKIRDGHGLLSTGKVTVWVDTGVHRSADPVPDVDYFVVYQGSSVSGSRWRICWSTTVTRRVSS